MLQLNFTPFPILTTERLALRQLTVEDANQIFLLRSDEKVNEFVDRPKATSINDAVDFINKRNTDISNNETGYWGITFKNENKIIGTITLWNISKENAKAEIGYEMLPGYQGKGLMQEALRAVIKYGFEIMNLTTIEGWMHFQNLRSAKLLEKNNFIRKPGEENNEIVYILTKNE